MFRDRAVLSLAAIKAAVGCDPVMVVRDFNCFVCNPHIDFAFYIFIRD